MGAVMPLGSLSFDSYESAKAAMELGEITFKCNVCRRNHRSKSRSAGDCGVRAYSNFPAYYFSLDTENLRLAFGLRRPYPWRCWGREKLLSDYAAVIFKIDDVLGAVRRKFEWKGSGKALAAVTKETFGKTADEFRDKFRSMVSSAVAEAQMIADEAASTAEELFVPGPPALPLPVVVCEQTVVDGRGQEMSYAGFIASLVAKVVEEIKRRGDETSLMSGYPGETIRDFVEVFGPTRDIAPGFSRSWLSPPRGFRFEEDGMYVLFNGGRIALANKSTYGANESCYSLLYVERYCIPKPVKYFFGDIDVREVLEEAGS